MDWTSIILAIITLLGGCGWLLDRHKYKQELEGLKADNKQKDMDLSKTYVDEFRKNIADPLRREVRELKREVKKLNNAINKIQECPHAADCPVYDELQKQQIDGGADEQEGGEI